MEGLTNSYKSFPAPEKKSELDVTSGKIAGDVQYELDVFENLADIV